MEMSGIYKGATGSGLFITWDGDEFDGDCLTRSNRSRWFVTPCKSSLHMGNGLASCTSVVVRRASHTITRRGADLSQPNISTFLIASAAFLALEAGPVVANMNVRQLLPKHRVGESDSNELPRTWMPGQLFDFPIGYKTRRDCE